MAYSPTRLRTAKDGALEYELRIYASNKFGIRLPITYGQPDLREAYPIAANSTIVTGGFRYYFGKFALDAGPRFNYVLNDGTYDVDMEYNVGFFRGSVPFEVEKGFNDSFVDILVGANYYFM